MKYLLVAVIFLLSACSLKEYEQTLPKIVIIKSPQIKFADLGYIRHTDKELEIELFVAGKVIDRISINHLICITGGCMSKQSFNREYLHHSYPDDILQNIFLGKSLYEAKNRVFIENGFEQVIEDKEVTIIYRVTQNQIFFKDKKNNIIIKIKDTQ